MGCQFCAKSYKLKYSEVYYVPNKCAPLPAFPPHGAPSHDSDASDDTDVGDIQANLQNPVVVPLQEVDSDSSYDSNVSYNVAQLDPLAMPQLGINLAPPVLRPLPVPPEPPPLQEDLAEPVYDSDSDMDPIEEELVPGLREMPQHRPRCIVKQPLWLKNFTLDSPNKESD